jgi:hypothetical protein
LVRVKMAKVIRNFVRVISTLKVGKFTDFLTNNNNNNNYIYIY